jgi:hypothetical protein
MEEVAGSLGRALFSTLKWFVLVVLFEIVFYWYGFGTIKLLTFGKHPQRNKVNKTLCAILGFISFCVTCYLASLLFGDAT